MGGKYGILKQEDTDGPMRNQMVGHREAGNSSFYYTVALCTNAKNVMQKKKIILMKIDETREIEQFKIQNGPKGV